MKPLLLFDVDGTIAHSGKKIESQMIDTLSLLKERFELGIVGGGKLEKILYQVDGVDFDHYFTECGCVYHKKIDHCLKEIYVKNIRKHELYPKINILIKEALSFLSNVDYTLTGNFVDLRNGIIYISLIGMVATDQERSYFIELNKKNEYISKLLTILKNKALEINILSKISICRGGEVGIAIYPVEYDKVQVLDSLLGEYNEIVYFGDKFDLDGNDYHLINNPNVIGQKVTCVENTLKILKSRFLL
jgi:HAD superfamily hydrolase (TIGR01484 family)